MFALARFQIHFGKALELFHRTRHAGMTIADIDLRYLSAFAIAGILHIEPNRHRPIAADCRRRDRQITVRKRCV